MEASSSPVLHILSSFLQANDKNNGFFRQLMPFFSPSTIHSSSLFQDQAIYISFPLNVFSLLQIGLNASFEVGRTGLPICPVLTNIHHTKFKYLKKDTEISILSKICYEFIQIRPDPTLSFPQKSPFRKPKICNYFLGLEVSGQLTRLEVNPHKRILKLSQNSSVWVGVVFFKVKNPPKQTFILLFLRNTKYPVQKHTFLVWPLRILHFSGRTCITMQHYVTHLYVNSSNSL